MASAILALRRPGENSGQVQGLRLPPQFTPFCSPVHLSLPPQEGVSCEFLGERQHRERAAWLQGGRETTHKSVRPCFRPSSCREPGFLILTLMLEPSVEPTCLRQLLLGSNCSPPGQGEPSVLPSLPTPSPARASQGQGLAREGGLWTVQEREQRGWSPDTWEDEGSFWLPPLSEQDLGFPSDLSSRRTWEISEGCPKSWTLEPCVGNKPFLMGGG